MALSAPGIGSGLDIKGIVSQLMELEKKPLTKLTSQATDYQSKLSAFGQLKSQIANLQDQAAKLADSGNWDDMSLASSNTAAVSGSVKSTAQPTSFTVQVSQLAQAQATAAAVVPAGQALQAGSLRIDLGEWQGNVFHPGAAVAVNVTVQAGDTLSQLATKINAAGAGVSATVLRDASGERLLMRSNSTGVSQGFRVQTSGAPELAALAYNPPASGGMSLTQAALNTQATVNGVAVTSTNNKLDEAVPGVSLSFLQVTGSPVEISVKRDTSSVRSNITNLVSSYNALSNALKEMTKYEPGTKTAGTLQGDATAVGLQGMLRRMISGLGPEGSSFKRLSDVGIEFQLDGTLKVNDTKLNAALNKPDQLQTFFTQAASGAQPGGMAVRLETLAKGMLAANGAVGSRYASLQTALARNSKDVENMNDKIARTEQRLTAQYSRLDGQMASLSALSTYVSQQVTTWNNQKG